MDEACRLVSWTVPAWRRRTAAASRWPRAAVVSPASWG